MELENFELEKIIKSALEDDTDVPPELNAKLMKKVKEKETKRKKVFVFNMKYAAAVAIVAVVGVSVATNNFGFKLNNINQTGMQRIAADGKEGNSEENINHLQNAELNIAVANDKDNNTIQGRSAVSELEEGKQKTVSDMGNVAVEKVQNRENSIISSIPENTSNYEHGTDNGQNALLGATKAESTAAGNYLQIAANGLGKALKTLNESVNIYLDGLYTDHTSNTLTVASNFVDARIMEDNAQEGDYALDEVGAEKENLPTKSNMKNSYEVLCDGERYYSVKINTEFADTPEEKHSKTYTIDKQSETIVTLDDIYSQNPEYKSELYNNISTQMKNRTKNDESPKYYIENGIFTQITGDENFYINDMNEVVVCFDSGVVAPVEEGEQYFNVGTP